MNHLHLKFALNLDNLASEIIETISCAWKNPLDPPIVIFPDSKLEQWFKLKWIEQKKVLANFNKKSIDNFLFEILVGDDKNRKKLSSDMLCNVVISYLKQKSGEFYNYELLGAGVKRYLETESGEVDDSRVFDFASTVAGLFLEYETSRPGGFFRDSETGEMSKGILDCWKQGKLADFFIAKNGKALENEAWQRELYSALFHNENGDSRLMKVFKEIWQKAGAQGDLVEYQTLPYIFESIHDAKTGKYNFKYNKTTPVFIIGLSGMGQFYRVILQEFAREHDVYAYIQNPCMEFWEDCSDKSALRPQLPKIVTDATDESEQNLKADENTLLRYWGKAGRDNIKLWSMASDYDFDFAECQLQSEKDDMPRDSLLHQVQWMVAHRTNELPKALASDDSLSVTAVPSKLREVEVLHSHVCKLLNGSATANGKPAKISEILVVAPNLDDYRTAIYQVFDQKVDLNIPYSIVDSRSRESKVAKAMATLFSIREKGGLSRPDFFSLARNPVVQQVRGIRNDEVSAWETWIVEMNVYRDRVDAKNNTITAWKDAVKRLLLARLSSVPVAAGEKSIVPYENIDSGNSASLCRFVDCVESLEAWCDKNAWAKKWGTEGITETALDAVTESLGEWLSIANPDPGFVGEGIIYQGVVDALEKLRWQYAAGSETVSWKILEQSLMAAACGSEYSCGHLLVNGLTFMRFAPNRTVPIKYLFMLGMDAKSFPGSGNNSTLDLRKSVRPWPGDDSPVAKNRYAFLCQLMSASEGFYISYVNKNLQKDEEFYPCSLVNDIRGMLKQWNEIQIDLDEKRAWSELFTAREIRNKENVLGFNSLEQESKNTRGCENRVLCSKLPERVSAYQLRMFLEDPFQAQANLALCIEDESEKPSSIEFEPLKFDSLQESALKKFYIAGELGIDQEPFDEGTMPMEPYGEKVRENARNNATAVATAIKNHYGNDFNISGRRIETSVGSWVLYGNAKIVAQGPGEVRIVDVKKQLEPTGFLQGYILALGILNEFYEQGLKEHPKVFVDVFNYSGKAKSLEVKDKPKEAREKLNEIYNKFFAKKFMKVLPVGLLRESFENIRGLENTINEYKWKDHSKSPWKFFNGRHLFDIENVSGFDENNFKESWERESSAQAGLLFNFDDIVDF